MRVRSIAVLAVASVATGCGTAEKPAGDAHAGMSASVAAMAPDTMMKRVDSTNAARRSDSAARRNSSLSNSSLPKAPLPRAPTDARLRDSAFGPTLELDSAGKLRPVKRRPRP